MPDNFAKSTTPTVRNPYEAQAVLTASPSALVVKAYEAAIYRLRKAIRAIEARDVNARYTANRQAYDIIEHLLRTLNFEKGGQIAEWHIDSELPSAFCHFKASIPGCRRHQYSRAFYAISRKSYRQRMGKRPLILQ